MYSGCFCFPVLCIGKKSTVLLPELAALNESCPNPGEAKAILTPEASDIEKLRHPKNTSFLHSESSKKNIDQLAGGKRRKKDRFASRYVMVMGFMTSKSTCTEEEAAIVLKPLQVPRTRVLKISRENGLQIAKDTFVHGEAETRVVAAFERYLRYQLHTLVLNTGGLMQTNGEGVPRFRNCVIISKNTDGTVIIGLSKCVHGKDVIHVLRENIIDIYVMLHNLLRFRLPFETIDSAYALTRGDFRPRTYGVSHEHYLRAVLRHTKKD
ncbi:unnamed protein product [Agarophyton chilense]